MHGWLVGSDGRPRAGWRILVYVALLLLLFVVSEYATSFLPRGPLGWVSNLLLTAAGLIAGWTMLVRFDRRPPGALGFAITPATGAEIASGLLLGAGLIGAASLFLFLSGTARFLPDTGSAVEYLRVLGWTFAYFSLAAALEEVLFRGYAFQALVEGIGVWPAVILASALFSLAHGDNPNLDGGERFTALGNIFLAGILLSLAYLRTRSLWFATALHTAWNWIMASVLGFPVSGLVLADTPLYDAVETGEDWWTGGEFGPEAGLAATIVLLSANVWLIRTRRLREPAEVQALRPIVDERLARAGL